MVRTSTTVASSVTSPTRETQAEATVIKEVLAVTTKTSNGHDELMQKGDL